MITLHPVTKENWYACTELQVTSTQAAIFPVPVVYWLAESKVEPSYHPMAIYVDDTLVGFLVYGIDPDDGEYWLIALLIDAQYQRRGYGKAAINALVERLKTTYLCQRIWVGHRPANSAAAGLYAALGFVLTHVATDGEIIRCLTL